MRWMLCAVAALALGGCEPPSTDDGSCVPRSGLYRVKYTVQSGDCGPLNEVIINADDPSGTAGCTGMAVPKDACGESTLDVRCQAPNATNSVVSRGKVRWADDGNSGSATLYIELVGASGLPLCTGIYSVTYSRP